MKNLSPEVQDAFKVLFSLARDNQAIGKFYNYSIKSLTELYERTGDESFMEMRKKMEVKLIEFAKQEKTKTYYWAYIYIKDVGERYGLWRKFNPSTGEVVSSSKKHEIYPFERLGELEECVEELKNQGYEMDIRRVPIKEVI